MAREVLDSRLAALWPQQYDVLTAQELRQYGAGERLIRDAVGQGALIRIRRGAYVLGSRWIASNSRQRNLLRIQAHALVTGPAGTYSHASAARLHGLHVWDVPATVHLTQPFPTTRHTRSPDVSPHHLVLPPGEVTALPGPRGEPVPVTSLERTVVDCARTMQLDRAAIIGDHALRSGAVLERINEILDSMPGSRGVRRARTAVALLDGRAESPGETRTRLLLSTFGIPMPVPQVELITRLGKHRVDFAWEDIMLILEFDGRSKYFDYSPTEQVLLEERQRENALAEIHWNFIRVDWAQLGRPHEFRGRIAEAMARAANRTSALKIHPPAA